MKQNKKEEEQGKEPNFPTLVVTNIPISILSILITTKCTIPTEAGKTICG